MTSPDFPLSAIDLSERYAAFATLRRDSPITKFADPEVVGTTMEFPPSNGYWALSRHVDVAHASRHPDIFLSGPGAVSTMDLPEEMVEYFSGMISTDNPKHARLRRIVSNAFNPRNVRAVEDTIERVAAETVTRAEGAGTGDFVTDIAAPFPLQIICDMMGVPPSDYATVLACSNVILSMGDPDIIPAGTDPIVAVLEAGGTLTALMEDLGRFRVENPIDDITSALVNAEIESEKLSGQELASFFVLLVTAGNETTRTAIAHGLHVLTQFPEQKQRWIDDLDGLTSTAVDEIVRWASPVTWMRRTLSQDYTLSGVDLSAGDKVLLFYNSANRDESAFVNPELFDLGRSPNDHYGFGAPGPHFCLGAHLARREISVMFRELLTRHPDIVSVGAPAQLESSFVNGIKRLAYRW
jgi:cytochrome P450